MGRRETSVERKMRDLASAATLERIRQDREKVSKTLRPLLQTLADRFLDAAFDVNALKRAHGIRDNNVSTAFARELGRPPKSYLNDCRLDVGTWLLERTTLAISRVAVLCGFENRNTFGVAFSARFEVSPREYRGRHGLLARIDRAELDRGLAGLLDAERGKELSHHMLEVGLHLGQLYEGFENSLIAADRALKAADYDAALAYLRRAESSAREEGFLDLSAVTARFAVAWHGRGTVRANAGDVDCAFVDLTQAREAYASVAELPARLLRRREQLERFGVSCETDDALYNALCPRCRDALKNDTGRTLRGHLRNALEPMPRGLEWFRAACEECYRVIWRAISAARRGLLDDAFQAVWLCKTASPFLGDPQAPSTRGRFIAALVKVEAGLHGDQNDRLDVTDLALADAEELGDFRLVAEARTWRASVLRAKCMFPEARSELAAAKEACRESPWLVAFHGSMESLLEDSSSNYREALRLACVAEKLYQELDGHFVGLLKIQQANALFFLGDFEAAIEQSLSALGLLDDRRDPIPAHGAIPILQANSFGSLGRWARAELALSRCQFNRQEYPGLAASEVFTRACLKLGAGRAREALRGFSEGKDCFERLHRPRDAALAGSYSVEASIHLGDRVAGIENAAAAVRFFEAAGSSRDTLEALGKLRTLLESGEIDVKAVAVLVRQLCRDNGGWLPEPS